MVKFDKYKPEIAMFCLQFAYAGVALLTRAGLKQGTSPRVFVVYRQVIATLVAAPIAYFASKRSKGGVSIGLRSFTLIFLTTLIGITINQNIYYKGLYLVSSSMASAMGNTVPAITFVMAAIIGLEKVQIRNIRSIAKILGTVLCVGGAVTMALLRGPKLLNALFILDPGGENWLIGCAFLFGSSCCWSLWLILQVPLTASYPDHLCLSAWMCLLGTLQSAAVTIFIEPDLNAWKLQSFFEFFCCVFAGVTASGIAFFVQAWCISQRGPLFSAMFNPLGTVIVTILAALFLHEEIYTGSMVGAAGVMVGLYTVLWGKARDSSNNEEMLATDGGEAVKVSIHDSATHEITCKIDLEEPLLTDKSVGGKGCDNDNNTVDP